MCFPIYSLNIPALKTNGITDLNSPVDGYITPRKLMKTSILTSQVLGVYSYDHPDYAPLYTITDFLNSPMVKIIIII